MPTFLKPITENEYTVHDSFSFAIEVSKFNSKNLMASLDVESLFTNIPLEETIDNIINDLFFTNDKVHNFEKEELKELLTFAANESFFIFDGEYYTQIDGVAMGSPLGPKLVNAFLCHFEKKWLSECPVEFLPSVYKRYVDNFTFEVEKNNKFSILDVEICKANNKLTTSVFRKPTFSGVFTNFDSFIPISYKRGLVNTLIFRCFKICSSYEKLHNQIVYLKEIFKRNRYSNDFVDLCIKKFFDKLYITKNIFQTVDKKQLMIILPFLSHLSFEARNRLNNCIRNQLPSCSLRIAFQSKFRL